MHVRVTTRRRGDKTYRSVQIVQSFRRPDGMPAHKVLATLGNLSDVETENLRRSIAASRDRELVERPRPARATLPKVAHNLAFLDVAACYRAWCSWDLSTLIDELVPPAAREVSVGEVAAALTVQRCVAPASELAAARWYERTALPELQGIAPPRFNNTRLHRVLELLAQIEAPLQQSLARRIATQQGHFVSLFLDCTDTWFVGRGPELAAPGGTKEGLHRQRIGIALLCDQRGLPLRWATLPGNHYEARSMMQIVDEVQTLPWARGLPLVADRAMGHGVTVEEFLTRGVQCVTAVPAMEIAGYSTRIPLGGFDAIPLGAAARDDAQVVAALRTQAERLGFRAASPTRAVLDLGVITKGEGDHPVRMASLAPARARAALELARRVGAQRERRTPWAELVQQYQCSATQLKNWEQLLALRDDLRARIDAGEADRLTPASLQTIAARPPQEQPAAFAAALAAASSGPRLRAKRVMARLLGVPLLQVRAVVLFNPERFIEQRQAAARHVTELTELVAQLNHRLAVARSTSARDTAVRKLSQALARRELVEAFGVEVETTTCAGRVVPQLRLVRRDEAWQRHRCTDGLTLIVAHPEVPGTAAELATLYFAKDQVEKDFQTIKSVLDLRPVHHRTDAKVRAHVTLCVLALLLERTLEQQLRKADVHLTADAALRELQPVHLNRYALEPALYSVTEVGPAQRRILAALNAQELADDAAVNARLTPR